MTRFHEIAAYWIVISIVLGGVWAVFNLCCPRRIDPDDYDLDASTPEQRAREHEGM